MERLASSTSNFVSSLGGKSLFRKPLSFSSGLSAADIVDLIEWRDPPSPRPKKVSVSLVEDAGQKLTRHRIDQHPVVAVRHLPMVIEALSSVPMMGHFGLQKGIDLLLGNGVKTRTPPAIRYHIRYHGALGRMSD
jgi:hypothetical protein